jgi:ubiquinone biosynthesis protein Coq4
MQQLELVQRSSFRDWLSQRLVSMGKPVYMLLRIRRKPWGITMNELHTMPEGTLGNDLAKFLEANDLQLMPKAEFHDVYHVLFQFNTTMRDETCLQFVPLGNGKRSLPYIISTLVATVFYPEHWEYFFTAYQKGRQASKFHHINFKDYLETSTAEVRRMIFEH